MSDGGVAPANVTEQISEHLVGTPFRVFDKVTLHRAKIRLLDALGNIAAGYRADGNEALRARVRRWAGAAEASILIDGDRVPAQNAAFINAVMMRSYDFEPVEAETSGGGRVAAHVTGTTASVALAVAESRHASGRELLTALILGDDLACRLAAATGFDVYSGGDNTGTINGFGGVAVAGRLADADAPTLRAAFGIVLNQLGGTIQNIDDKTSAFKLPMAFAARNSIVALELAEAGMSAPVDAIGARHGFLNSFGGSGAGITAITQDLGSVFYADSVIKPWSSCRASHPSLDACARIAARHELDPARIARVTVHVTPRTRDGFVGQPFAVGDCLEASAAFSIPFTAATALMYRTVRPEHLTREHLSDPRLTDLLGKIELVGSLPPGERLTAEVDVELDDGTVLHERVDKPGGDIHVAPLSDDEVTAKFVANVAYNGRISADAAQNVVTMVQRLETLPDVSDLVRLLIA